MFQKLRDRAKDEKGFTLIELLVVILIVGILAAIALPTFLGQQKKGQDSEAKSNARNLVSHVESCFAETQAYASCMAPADTGLTLGTNPGEVQAATPTANGYTITAVSKSGTVATPATFSILKNGTGSVRYCSIPGEGGCKTGTPAGAPAGTGSW